MMRRYHRWISFPLIVFLLIVTATGLDLQVVELAAETGGKQEAALVRTAPDRQAILAAVDRSLAIAEARHGDFPLQKIELSFTPKGYQAKLSTNRRIGPSVTVASGEEEPVYVARPARTLRTVFVLLHSGKYLGVAGLTVILLAGIVLLALSVTGLVVYLDMYARRRKAGKGGFFWK